MTRESWRDASAVERAGLENRKSKSRTGAFTDTYESMAKNLASFLALLAQNWPDLAELVTAWPDLPEALQTGMMAMVRSGAREARS